MFDPRITLAVAGIEVLKKLYIRTEENADVEIPKRVQILKTIKEDGRVSFKYKRDNI